MKTKTLIYIAVIVCLFLFASTAQAQDKQPETRPPTLIEIILTGVVAVLVVGAIAYTVVRQYQHAQTIREMDWTEYFTEVISDARTEKEAGQDVSTPGKDADRP